VLLARAAEKRPQVVFESHSLEHGPIRTGKRETGHNSADFVDVVNDAGNRSANGSKTNLEARGVSSRPPEPVRGAQREILRKQASKIEEGVPY